MFFSLYYKAVTSCLLDELSDETGSKSAGARDLGKPQIMSLRAKRGNLQIFLDSRGKAAGKKQEGAMRSLVSSSWLLLENLWTPRLRRDQSAPSAVSFDLVAAGGRAETSVASFLGLLPGR